MIFQRFFTPRPQVLAAKSLFASASVQARSPAFYTDAGVPDTPEGRFELYTLHVALLLRRLSGDEPQVAETRQGLFDAFVRNLDDGLREMGVGDLSVGKKMRKLGAAIYGRLRSYNDALGAADSLGAVGALVKRTVFVGGDATADPVALARYVLDADRALVSEPMSGLLKGEVTWPSFQK
jgi:cytochrome b pre-mRNA-processing protein 3